ncbi:MAG: adenosine deaminase [Bacteroidota bacterium]
MDYRTLPKIELHLHLDCSLSYSVIRQIDPTITEEDYRRDFVAPPRCSDLVDYIQRAEKAIGFMQTPEQLRAVTLDLFDQLKADGLVYSEIRFAPLLHLAKGLSPTEVVEAVESATREGIERTGVEAGLILCTLRHYDEEQSMTTVKLVEAFRGTKVVGFDVAGDEAGYPVQAHVAAFEYAEQKELACTAHAGEACGPKSVWEVLQQFRPRRIGHGVRSIEDPVLIEHLKAHDIHLEVCPTSNLQTNIYERIEEHPADRIFHAGVSMSVNTDARTATPTTLSGEYALLQRVFGWTLADFKHCNLQAVRHCFAPQPMKAHLRQLIEAGYPVD